MFIKIIYRDSPELSTATLSSEDLSEEKTLILNPKCPVGIMLEYIRGRCRLGVYTCFDLCAESGVMMGLPDMPPYEYATDHFESGGTYYVIVIRQEKSKTQIFPQLNRNNPLYAELKVLVRRFLQTQSTSSSSRDMTQTQ